MERARADARSTSGWCRPALSGLSERGRAAAWSGLPARGNRARLRAPAREGGAARLLALAVALPRRGRHVPAERQRRRRVRGRRAARRRDRPAARPRALGARQTLLALLLAPLVGRRALLRRAGGAAYRDAA